MENKLHPAFACEEVQGFSVGNGENRRELGELLASRAELIIPSLTGETVESFCLRAANTWKLGRKGIYDGIVVCLAPNDRKVRIELGVGINRYISTEDAKEIIGEMTPFFKLRNYAQGLRRGLEHLMEEGRRYKTLGPTEKSPDNRG